MTRRGAVFIDRDGVVNEPVPDGLTGRRESPLIARDVVLVDGAAGALRRLANSGWRLIGVSNQPAAAKGQITLAQLYDVQSRVLELLLAEGVRFDDFRLCLHHPEGVVKGLTGPCDCRKPAPGMLLGAARDLDIELSESWMVGDTDGDMLAGRAVAASTILIEHPGSAHKRGTAAASPDATVASLSEAADVILGGRASTLRR